MELLEAKDITKKEVSSLQSEIQHLKRQNVVNANRVVVLEVIYAVLFILFSSSLFEPTFVLCEG